MRIILKNGPYKPIQEGVHNPPINRTLASPLNFSKQEGRNEHVINRISASPYKKATHLSRSLVSLPAKRYPTPLR